MTLALIGTLCWTRASRAEDVQVSTVFAYGKSDPYDRSNLYGFNHAPSIVLLPDGRLLSAWFSGPFEASVHQLILGATSADGGRTWAQAVPMVDFPRASDFDPAFIVKGSSTWMFFSVGRWDRYPVVGSRAVEQTKVGKDSFRVYVRRSLDSGKTWSDPVLASTDRGFCRSNGIVLKTGAMLLPVYDDIGVGNWVSSVLRSDDEGVTWRRLGKIQALAGKAGGEPTLAELDDGSVLMALRSRDGHVWFSQSRDGGATWSVPVPSDYDAAVSSHALFRTKAGRVLLAYNACKPPLRSPLVLRTLDQKTMSWGSPIRLAEVPAPEAGEKIWTRQVAYPSIAELPDGVIVVVWAEIANSADEQSGRIKCARISG